jgi:PEP-CTERM motif
MKTSKNYFRFFAASLGITAPLWFMSGAAHAEDFTDPSVNSYWGESWTDIPGTYNSPASNTTVSGDALNAPIPTDAIPALNLPDYDVVNYVRVYGDVYPAAATYYNGTLLGDLSAKSGLTATFSLNNSTLAPGAPFQSSQFVGEGPTDSGNQYIFGSDTGQDIYTGTPSPRIGLVFTGGGADGEWWSTSGVTVTNINNGQGVTLTTTFDPSAWSDVNGQNGATDPTDFDAALSSVDRIGLSFGSGDFFADGFSFDTGGAASLQLDSINTTVPEPTSLSLLGVGALALLRRRRRTQQ